MRSSGERAAALMSWGRVPTTLTIRTLAGHPDPSVLDTVGQGERLQGVATVNQESEVRKPHRVERQPTRIGGLADDGDDARRNSGPHPRGRACASNVVGAQEWVVRKHV